MIGIHRPVQQVHPFDAHRSYDRLDPAGITAFGEVGNALDYRTIHCCSALVIAARTVIAAPPARKYLLASRSLPIGVTHLYLNTRVDAGIFVAQRCR